MKSLKNLKGHNILHLFKNSMDNYWEWKGAALKFVEGERKEYWKVDDQLNSKCSF